MKPARRRPSLVRRLIWLAAGWSALALLVTGGVLYSTGVVFYVNKRLKFARAIWHGHVVAGAAAHWTAVLLGVVLAAQH